MAGPDTALLLIDVQRDILLGKGGPDVQAALDGTVERIAGLLDRARRRGFPVIHVQHDGELGHRLERGTPGWELRPEVAPRGSEPVVHKRSCDAFFETKLPEILNAQQIRRLVVAGCMTEYCIDTTCRRAVSLFRDVVLAADGHTTGDSGELSFRQIVAHHNRLLDGFSAGRWSIQVVPSGDIGWSLA
ncbi:MAG TPA: cysteine hydrolase family protein [Myxococcaceae bacterium]|nr:cysteine hydrolase family protein [Myxococcaceae bacterium]